MTEMIELDLSDLWRVLIKRIWIIVLCTAIAGAAALVYTVGFIEPQYTAKVTMYVNNKSGENTDYVSSGELTAALRLVGTYVNIINSDSVLEKAANDSGLMMEADQIRSMLSASAVSNTEMFTVSVTCANPQMAADIANAVARVAPDEISKIIEGSSAKIIDYAKVPTRKSSPNNLANVLTGLAIGFLLAVLAVVIIHLADNRVRGERELEQICAVPVLGRIPDLDVEVKSNTVLRR